MSTRLTIDQAAAALRVSRATIRRRLRNGQLQGEQVPTAQGFVWQISVDSPATESPPSQPTPQVDEGARLRDEHIADLRRRVDDQAREIAELHRLLANQQQLLLMPPQAATRATPQTTPRIHEDAAPAWGRRSWWQRLVWG